ncbi:MAG: hypothetical protein KBD00_01560 [Candidatus Peribacteraceae bacterium]|nr:hypothetical protein [Candidatus Peribacteraceae bacterium]
MLKISAALTMGKKGDVALPKAWLKKQKEKTFIAEENSAGHLVLRSIQPAE